MNTHWNTGAAALAVAMAAAGAMLACSNDTTAPQSETTYVAQLGGNNEVPAIPGAASGTATFTLTGKSLSYRVTVSGLSGNAAASHIHVGGAGVNGNIIVPFSAAQVRTGEVASGLIDLTLPISNGQTTITGDSLLFLLDHGLAYTNVHTPDHPAGEIRGQILKVTAGGGNGGGSSGGGSNGGGGNGGGGGIY
jgi:CHRD domain-containing protein